MHQNSGRYSSVDISGLAPTAFEDFNRTVDAALPSFTSGGGSLSRVHALQLSEDGALANHLRGQPLSVVRRTLESLALAPGTMAQYRSLAVRFHDCCRQHGLCPLPATGDTVAEFYCQLVADGSTSLLRTARAVLRRIHTFAHLRDPTLEPECEAIAAACRSWQSGLVKRRARPSITSDLVEAVLENPGSVRAAVAVSLGFLFLLRASELRIIRRKDISRRASKLALTIARSKTNKIAETRVISLDQTPRGALAAKLWSRLDALPASQWLFCEPDRERAPTYQALRGAMEHELTRAGSPDAHLFAPHALRRGGCQWLLECGTSREEARHFGRWQNVAAMDPYLSASMVIDVEHRDFC